MENNQPQEQEQWRTRHPQRRRGDGSGGNGEGGALGALHAGANSSAALARQESATGAHEVHAGYANHGPW